MRKALENEMQDAFRHVPDGLKANEQKLTKMLLLVFVCFLFSYGPGAMVKLVSIPSRAISIKNI